MDGIGSERAGIYGNGFNLKSFARINPPLLKNHDHASRRNENPPLATDSSGSITAEHPASSEDIPFRKTQTFIKWSLVTPRESWRLSPDEDRSKSLFLRIYDQIHEGCTWDVFRGEMGLSDFSDRGRLQPIVLKLTKLSSFRELAPEDTTFWDSEHDNDRCDVEEKITNEDYFLRCYLKALQGDIVPYYYGMFIWRKNNDQRRERRPCLTKKEIFQCYRTLFKKAKVVHHAWAPNHILKRDEVEEEHVEKPKLALIGFEDAVSCASWTLDARKAEERSHLSLILSLLGSQKTKTGTVIPLKSKRSPDS
ncbi:hypothetical protein V865_004925 [Kwoniella europaea PYCC6329]|uniref:Fungal-type protein kinase domain-containing protein n=1 Tax=Kwoniella europaea PYCC6329 TaxID=1423913 RepID=A0AAX4KL19_9TREE